VQALREFCELADGVDELLQSKFGGHTTFADEMPSINLHQGELQTADQASRDSPNVIIRFEDAWPISRGSAQTFVDQ
jgi:hypothetical protein